MNQKIQDITDNIFITLSNINTLKNTYLEENLIDKYNMCNDLRINFKKFYKAALDKISAINEVDDCDFSSVNNEYQKIKTIIEKIGNSQSVIVNIEYSIDHIKKLTKSLIEDCRNLLVGDENMKLIKNQILRFNSEISY